jgi:hypothetical protein
MSLEEFHAAVLAFLEQFIARGAANDVIELSRRLRDNPDDRDRLDAHLHSATPSEREAYDAMAAFFWAEARPDVPAPAGGPSLVLLASWTQWGTADLLGNELTQDPAQWHDWLASVQQTRDRLSAEP